MNKAMVVSVILLVLVGIGVSRMKYEVVFLRRNLKILAEETKQCLDNIKVLEAEWSYLNNPKRLKTLAEKYLPEMKPIGIKQVMSYNKVISSDLTATKKENHSAFDSLLEQAIGGN